MAIEKINLNNLDKSDWKTYRFDEIAQNISERVDPNDTDLEVYVGLEHLDSESLHITRHGSPDDVNGTKLRFYKGDIIFGRRRAYQRKAGIATWDGFCSAHALVLRANPDVIHPDLFPFFMHSDLFMNRAVDISVGSLSPTINWGTLKHQEFLVPPIEIQQDIAKLYWSLDDTVEAEIKLDDAFEAYMLVALKNIFSEKSKRVSLKDVCREKPKYGANQKAVEYDNHCRYIRITDIGDFSILNNKKVSAETHDEKYVLKYGDFLIARSADPGRSYYYKKTDGLCSHAGYLIKFTLDLKKILPEYLYYFTQTAEYKSWINQTTRKGTLSNINSQEFSKMRVPLVDISDQKKSIDEISKIYLKSRAVKDKILKSIALKNSLINKVF